MLLIDCIFTYQQHVNITHENIDTMGHGVNHFNQVLCRLKYLCNGG